MREEDRIKIINDVNLLKEKKKKYLELKKEYDRLTKTGEVKRFLEELKKDRTELENSIYLLIKEFEEKWGVSVSDIDLEHFRTIQEEKPVLNKIKVEVEL